MIREILKDFYHYLLILNSGLFDRAYYLRTYPDVRKADINPLWQFIRWGWREGRNPSSNFNTSFYLRINLDVRQAGVNPLVHYIKNGEKEGRALLMNVDLLSSSTSSESQARENYQLIAVFNQDYKPTNIESKNNDFPQSIHILNTFQKSIQPNIEKSIEKQRYSEVTISVIIPTKNAGDDFEYLLKMLLNQKGIGNIEIIIIDSGSNDKTLEVAKEFNTKIIEIQPEDFSHSFARNLGAENASGEYLLFTVQDALPPTTTWIYKLLTALFTNDVSAVSCAESPRENADLYYRVICWNHYNFLDVNKYDRIFTMPKSVNYLTLRQNGQLSDLACLISKDLFSQYKYRLNYAEDLDLGIRLINDGKRISFLGSTRIIHSHNRSAFYFLKRSYVDNLFLSDIFIDFPVANATLIDTAFDIACTFNFVHKQLSKNNRFFRYPNITTEKLKLQLKKSLSISCKHSFPTEKEIKNIPYIDQDLKEFIIYLLNSLDYRSIKINNKRLIQQLIGFMDLVFNYIEGSHEIIDIKLFEEIKFCLFKGISSFAGANLAHCYITRTERERKKNNEIHSLLIKNV